MSSEFEAARDAYVAGNYPAALAALAPLIDGGGSERAFLLLGETLVRLAQPVEARNAFRRAADCAGPLQPLCHKRAAELCVEIGDHQQAQLHGLKALQAMPNDPDLAYLLIRLFLESGETALVDALKDRLVASDRPEHLHLAADLIGDDLRNPANLTLHAKLRALHPADAAIRFKALAFAREFCDFDTLEREQAAIDAEIAAGNLSLLAGERPHYSLMWCGDEALNRLARNQAYLAAFTPASRAARRSMPHEWQSTLRIGYVSADFWDDHATMRLLQSVLEVHDRDRFDITLFDYTPDRFVAFDGGGRSRWGRIVPIGALDDASAIETIRCQGIDILVDLKGSTGNARPNIFNGLAAPVQVAWLGFPGSTPGVDCDYVIGDRFVTPDASQPHYHETFCRLPDSYQPNDPVHRPRPQPMDRAAAGLPADAFVLAAFNATRKITPATMDLWLDCLSASPNAVLWLMCDFEIARGFILDRARRRGIDPARILFARKVAYAEHVSRLALADLGLDSFPCNGHTTTSDCLWAGVPVLTMKGTNFASRVSESLLAAVGLPQLVTADRTAFVAEAARLAADPAEAAGLKAHLVSGHDHLPLFDHRRFTRHLEAAFEAMAARARAGLPPAVIDVPRMP